MSSQAVQILEVATIAILMGTFILVFARRQLISFRYTIGWLSLCAVSFIGALLIPEVEPIADFLKVDPIYSRWWFCIRDFASHLHSAIHQHFGVTTPTT